MNIEKREQIAEILCKDEAKLKELANAEPATVVEYLAAQGCDCAIDEVVELGEWLKETIKKCANDNGELNVELLDEVVGGCKSQTGKLVLVAVGLTLAFAACGW